MQLFFYNKTGCLITKDGKYVHDELNKKAMNQQYGLVWDKNLDLSRGVHIKVYHPVNQEYVVVYGTKVEQFRQLFDKKDVYWNYWLVNKSSQQVIDNSAKIQSDTNVSLSHKVTFTGEINMIVYVENGASLSNSIPYFPDEFLQEPYELYLNNKLFQNKSIIQDFNLTIKVACGHMTKETCRDFSKTCMWIGESCEGKSWLVPIIIICCFAVLACIGAAAFVIVSRVLIKKSGGYEDIGLIPTVKIHINGKKTILMLDEEIGRGEIWYCISCTCKRNEFTICCEDHSNSQQTRDNAS